MAPKDSVPDPDTHVVADPKNGVVTPVYSDRQVVRASDLTLDRESHEAALARMRRLLHGWGIVSGFVPRVPEGEIDVLKLSPGYAVAPSGAEVFLPQEVTLTDLVDRIMKLCGPAEPDCGDITEEAQAKAKAARAAASATVGAWLIARPAFDPTDPRPGVPEGCENPGNMQLPTRHCHMIRLELLCTLPKEKILPQPRCAAVTPYICADVETGQTVPYPYPSDPGGVDDYVVIGYLRLVRKTEDALTHVKFLGFGVEPILEHRRFVLPNAVLQDWMQACLCPILRKKPDETDTPANPGGGSRPWREFLERADALSPGLVAVNPDILPDDGVTDPPRELLRERGRLEDLEAVGILGPEAFLRADIEDLVLKTGLPAETVLTFKKDIVASEALWKTEASAPAVSESWEDFSVVMFDGGVSNDWNATDTPAARDSVKEQPLLTSIAASPEVLKEKGLAGPADVLAVGDVALAEKLGVSVSEASAVKVDLMRFTGLMGRSRG